jgi:hypothetical protein
MAKISKIEDAVRLARAIVSDVLLYNRDKVRHGLENDSLFEVLKDELEEGRELYESRVDPDLLESGNYYDRAVVDVLIKQSAEIETKIW